MKRIAILLILFQLIGCTQQPVVIASPKSVLHRETPTGDTPQAPKTNYMGIVGVGLILVVGTFAVVGITKWCGKRKARGEAGRKPSTPKEQEKLQKAQEREQKNLEDYNKIYKQLCTTLNEKKWIGALTEMQAAYGYSMQNMGQRLLRQKMRNDTGEEVSLFTYAAKERC
jgi:hypothetical protein